MTAEKDSKEWKDFLEHTWSIASKAAGGTVGVVASIGTGYPLVGALTAPFVAVNLEKIGKELISRRLGAREEQRLGLGVRLAYEKFKERVDRRDRVREDGYFDDDGSGRSAADEINEASLNAAMRAYEEKKIPYIANLMANICFDDSVDRPTANTLVDLANRLTYRSFVIMKICSHVDKLNLVKNLHGTEGSFSDPAKSVICEVSNLIQCGMLVMKDNDDTNQAYGLMGLDSVNPSITRLDTMGRILYALAGLSEIAETDEVYVKTVEALRMPLDEGVHPAAPPFA
ncbi:hypothetical protein [Methylobacterium nigriterrae]|uniref:hypothetical protein n=1 Tax=Methylobacterium nigriterrae TaxID=3127512 RepID=UPI0030135936